MDANKAAQLIKEAMAAVQRGDLQAALVRVTQFTPISPLYPQSLHLHGLIVLAQGRHSEALQMLLAAMDGGDQSPLLATNVALAAMAGGVVDAGLLRKLTGWLTGKLPDAATAAALMPLLDALRFSKQQDFGRDGLVFRELVVPLLHWSAQRQHYDIALFLEGRAYEAYVKQRETEAHYRECFALLAPSLVDAGRRLGQKLPMLTMPQKSRPRIGFFIHNASMLAHIEALINMLAGYRTLAEQPFDPVVYCFGGKHAEMMAAFQRIDVPVVMLEVDCPDKSSFCRRLMYLRERLAADGACCLVWVSLSIMMSFAFSMRVAPVQIWWSMKFHALALDDIDGYVTSGSFSRTEFKVGRLWRAGRLQVANRHDPSLRPEAERIAATYRPHKIIGTLARHELIRSAPFLDVVIEVLRRNPDAVYLWTGRQEAPDIVARFQQAGIADRTCFVGWVNIKVYAQVLDVFLDTFPFGCGFALLDTMAAGTPVVFMDADPAGDDPSYDRIIRPMLEGRTGAPEDTAKARAIFTAPDGESLFLHAADKAEYVRIVTRLLNEPAWARAAGAAGKAFMDSMMSNPQQSARDFAEHFMEVIQERRMTLEMK